MLSFFFKGHCQDEYIFELVTIDERANFGDVHNLYEDETGIIWLGIFGKGLAYYNGKTIERFSLPDEEKFANRADLFVGNDNYIYINDGDGVRIFDPIQHNISQTVSLSEKQRAYGEINSIAVTEKKSNTYLWASLVDKNSGDKTTYQILVSVNGSSFKKITPYPLYTYGAAVIKAYGGDLLFKEEHSISAVDTAGAVRETFELAPDYIKNLTTFNWHVDAQKNIRLGGRCLDVGEITGEYYNCELIERLGTDPTFTKTVSSGYDTYSTKLDGNKKYARIVNVLENEPYRILRETDSIGFVKNLNTQHVLNVTTIGSIGHKPGNIFKVFKSKSGIIWIGGSNGLSKLVPQPKGFMMLRPLSRRSFIEDETGIVYGSMNWVEQINPDNTITLLSSIMKYDPQTKKIVTHSSSEGNNGYWFQAIYENGKVYHNEFKRDLKTGEKELIPEIFEDLGYAYLSLIDKEGKLWKANWGVPFIAIYDPATGKRLKKTTIPQLQSKPVELNDWYQRPSDGTVWLGTYGQGVFIFTAEGELIQHLNRQATSDVILRNNIISGFYEDSQKRMWLGHGAGLSVISPDFSSIAHYTFNPAQPESRLVYSILPEDNDRYLWLGTSKGLFRFDRETENFQDFPLHPQMMKFEFNRTSFLKASNGQFYFGTSSTNTPTVSFFPEEAIAYYDNLSEEKSNIIITSFSKFDASTDSKISQKERLQALDTIIIEPGDRYFELEYLVSDFRSPENNYYSFFLKNYDSKWNKISRDNNTVRYENLPPGTYTLKLGGALTPSGVTSNIKSIVVSVMPFWYQKTSVRVLALCMLISLFYVFYRFNLKNQYNKQEALRLQGLSEIKSKLYTNITHEFRTPLTVIMGISDSIKGHKKQRELIKRNSKNLLGLINQLLDLSKLDAGQLTVKNTYNDIIPYLQYLTESFYSFASDKEVKLSFRATTTSLFMYFDEDKIQHCIYNLLSNALKFTDSGGSVIFSVDEVVEHNDMYLKISVTDTGIGIPQEKLPRIFERFYQVDNTKTQASPSEGTGVGLAITKEFVELLGGTISVTSNLEQGSTFEIKLPVVTNENDSEPNVKNYKVVSENSTPEKKPETPDTDPKKSTAPVVLLVEDSSGIVTYLESFLSEPYQLLIAKDGQEGIDKALEFVPDMIITDVMMPKKNGYELCQILKNDMSTSHIPIIMLTAKATDASRIEGLKLGADAYISKPFERDELLIRIEKLLEVRKQMQRYYAGQLKVPVPENFLQKQEDEFLNSLQSFVEEKLQKTDLSINEFAEIAGISQMQLYRKLKALAGQTPTQFVRKIRLKKALHLLNTTTLNISEIAYEVGFNDPNYFTRVFKKEFGEVPGDYRS